MLLKVTQLNWWLPLATAANGLICLIVFGQQLKKDLQRMYPSLFKCSLTVLTGTVRIYSSRPLSHVKQNHDGRFSLKPLKPRASAGLPFPSFRPATTGSAPSQRPWLATMFAICTMRAWGVKMATVLIEKQRWHIPFCARNKTEPFTNPHIRKVGTMHMLNNQLPSNPLLLFSPPPPKTKQLWLLLFDQCCVCVYASGRVR